MKKKVFFSFPGTIWETALYEVFIFSLFNMKNNFINNNGATLLNTKNKKTKVESLIEELKKQEQAINEECDNCQINYSVTADNQITEMRSIPGGQITK